MSYTHNGYKIIWHDHDNQRRDYFVIDPQIGECVHYTGTEQCCLDAIDNQNFNLVNRSDYV